MSSKNKKKQWILSAAVLLLLCLAVILPVSADSQETESNSLFSVPGKTIFVNPQVIETRSASSIDYGPLHIPELVKASSDAMKSSSIRSSNSEMYDIVAFNNLIPVRSNTVSMPVILNDAEYTINLQKVNFDTVDDGIDSYQGTIAGMVDSVVLLTVTNENLLYGNIRYGNESIVIYPIQNREYTQRTAMPLHVTYSEADLLQPTEPIPFCGVDENMLGSVNQSENNVIFSNKAEITRIGEYDYDYVNILIVTDNEFYTLESNWVACAQDLLNEANYQYQRPDIKVVLSATYDASKRNLFSTNSTVLTEPLNLSVYLYPVETYLNPRNIDVCVYLGGNDIIGVDGTAQGLGFQPGRYTWSQMVDDAIPAIDFYDGTRYARVFCFIHELGHSRGACHEQAYVSFFTRQSTVMDTNYLGSTFTHWDFSSPLYNGDADHDNAKLMRQNKTCPYNHCPS